MQQIPFADSVGVTVNGPDRADLLHVLVLSDGAVADTIETALDARRVGHRVRVLERDPALAPALRAALPAETDVASGDWRGCTDPVALSGAARGWVLVLAAGERLATNPVGELHDMLRHSPLRGAHTVHLRGSGPQLRIIPVAPHADGRPTPPAPTEVGA